MNLLQAQHMHNIEIFQALRGVVMEILVLPRRFIYLYFSVICVYTKYDDL